MSENALHQKLCQHLSNEANLKELQQLAKDINIPYSGLKKADLCNEIATILYYSKDKLSAYDDLYNPYNTVDLDL